MEESTTEHMRLFASHLLAIEARLPELKPFKGHKHHILMESQGMCLRGWNPELVEADGVGSSGRYDSGLGQSLPRCSQTQLVARLQDTASESAGPMDWRVDQKLHAKLESMMAEKMVEIKKELMRNFMGQLREKDEEISGLKTTITKLEKTIRSKNAESEDRDFRLSLIENSNHDGSMIWKIPQFSQRKTDAQNGKYTSIFSLPFYSGRYGYKMCLRLYIMGDGIGKGTHLSLFFVVMRGEFDNILQWPFTHKVTFKLINQAGGRDIVDTFQPDPMSSSFRKPRSDMNIASGSPRFVSHTELERGGFIVDDTIFVKCLIDTSSIRHP